MAGDTCLRYHFVGYDKLWGCGHKSGGLKPTKCKRSLERKKPRLREESGLDGGTPIDAKVTGDDGRMEGQGGPPSESAKYRTIIQ